MTRPSLALLLTACAFVVPPSAAAQTYPSQRVRVIVPFAAGGPADTITSIIVQKLPENWSRQTVIDNLPAGASNVGTAAVAKTPADGHTILATVGTIVTNPSRFARLPWHPVRDFAPISLVAT